MDNFKDMSQRDKREVKKYHTQAGLGLAVYMVTLIGVLVLVDEDSGSAKYWIMLPMIGVAIVAYSMYGFVSRSDEYGQRLHMSAMSVGFGVAMVASTGFGFLGLADVGHPAVGPWVTFSLGMLGYAIAAGVVQMRDA